jgi:hypothetical protein
MAPIDYPHPKTGSQIESFFPEASYEGAVAAETRAWAFSRTGGFVCGFGPAQQKREVGVIAAFLQSRQQATDAETVGFGAAPLEIAALSIFLLPERTARTRAVATRTVAKIAREPSLRGAR